MGKGLIARHTGFARRPDDGEIGHHLGDASPGDELHRVAPVGSDVRHRARCAAERGIHPPVVVGFQQHPVLQIAAVRGEQPSDIARAHHARRLAHHCKLAIDKAHAVHHARLLRQRHQLARLVRGHAQRLFGKHVLARPQDLAVNLRVQVVRRAVVHHVQIGVREQFLNAAVGMRHIQGSRLFLRLRRRAVAQGNHLHKTEASKRLDMRRADKPAADNPDVNHACLLPRSRQTRARRPG